MGHDAWQMIGRTPSDIVAERPLRQGAITDFDVTQRMIRLLLHRVRVGRFNRPRWSVCPSAITEVERRAVAEAARRAGATDAFLIEQPMAAAIGCGLPIHEPIASLVIDVGAAPRDCLVSLGGVVALDAVRVGSFDIDGAIQAYVRRGTASPWASARPRRSRSPSDRRGRCATSSRPRFGGGTWHRACRRL